MGFLQFFQRATPAPTTTTTTTTTPTTTKNPTGFWLLFGSNAILSALSITNLGLISSMVGWLLDQKHNVHSFLIDWPGNPTALNVEPKNMWVDQGHESNGVAGYGFFLGIFGMITAWRLRKAGRPLRSLIALAILQFLAILFTLSAFIFVFVVTYQTTGQYIREPIAANNVGNNYPEFRWTPETWMKAVLDLPLADNSKRNEISSRVTSMVAWRWILLPIFLVDIAAFSITILTWLNQRRDTAPRSGSEDPLEK